MCASLRIFCLIEQRIDLRICFHDLTLPCCGSAMEVRSANVADKCLYPLVLCEFLLFSSIGWIFLSIGMPFRVQIPPLGGGIGTVDGWLAGEFFHWVEE